MNLTPRELFKAMNDRHENLKDCEGMVISPVAVHTHTYTAADGSEHQVLVIKYGKFRRASGLRKAGYRYRAEPEQKRK